jgi:hypothetical protein
MSIEEIPEPWKSFFGEIDARSQGPVVLHCLGGFVLTTIYGLARATGDVDVVADSFVRSSPQLVVLAGKRGELHQKYGVYLDPVGIAPLPEDYELRLVEIFPKSFRRVRLFALDPYDIALAKLERNTQRDRDDVRYLARTLPMDLNVLESRYEEELKPILGNPDRESLTLRLWIEMIQEDRAASPRASG